MPVSATFPILGLLAVTGSLLGVHFGRSAIAEINPLHFQGPALHPRDRGAAVDEQALAKEGPRWAGISWNWSEGARDCETCDAIDARDRHVFSEPAAFHDPYLPSNYEGSLPHLPPSYYSGLDEAEWEQVERYAHYPIETEVAAIYD